MYVHLGEEQWCVLAWAFDGMTMLWVAHSLDVRWFGPLLAVAGEQSPSEAWETNGVVCMGPAAGPSALGFAVHFVPTRPTDFAG